MAFRKGRTEFLTEQGKRKFIEYARDTQEELVKLSFHYRLDEALQLQLKLIDEFREFTRLYRRTSVPEVARRELLEIYHDKRKEMWTTLGTSFRVLALHAVYYEKDKKAVEAIQKVLMHIPMPEEFVLSDNIEKLMAMVVDPHPSKEMEMETDEEELFY